MPITDQEDFTITLQAVQNPNPIIETVAAPATAAQGASVAIIVNVMNNGQGGTVWAQIKDVDTGGIVGARQSSALSSGAHTGIHFSLTMPNKNYRLRAEVGYGT